MVHHLNASIKYMAYKTSLNNDTLRWSTIKYIAKIMIYMSNVIKTRNFCDLKSELIEKFLAFVTENFDDLVGFIYTEFGWDAHLPDLN